MSGSRLACALLLLAPALTIAGPFEEGVEALNRNAYEKAVACFSAHILQKPRDAVAYYHRGAAYRKNQDCDRAIWDYTMAIRLDPQMAVAFNDRGMAYASMRDYARAVADYTEAIRLKPGVASVFNNRGLAYARLKDHDRAITDFTEAVWLDPRMAIALNNRANVHADKKEYAQASADYARAVQLDPNDALALTNFAWLLATCPADELRDGSRAVAYATKACQLSDGKAPGCLTAFAAALAEYGDFKAAILWEHEALQIGFTDPKEAEKARRRIRLYASGKPYRDR